MLIRPAAAIGPMAAPQVTLTIDFVARPIMWMFLAVLLTFLATRFVTRRIRTQQRATALRVASAGPDEVVESAHLLRNISLGGVHIHHQVFGILLMSVVGIGVFATSPEGSALNVCAALFGVGLSLAFDEFAMWLHLDDVYWSPEGRRSIDAIFCVLMITGILVGGADFVTGEVGTDAWWSSIVVLLITLTLAIICLLKGKVMVGVVGVVLWPVVIVGAIRLGKPESWWGRRFYRRQRRRLVRSRRRFGPAYTARWNRVRDFFGGRPDLPEPAPVPAALGWAADADHVDS